MTDRSEDLLAQRRLGAAIRHLRTERGFTRRQLEKATGLSYPYLSEIEAGKKSPSSRSLRVIADALGLEAHELMETAEAGAESRSGTAPRGSPFHESPSPFRLSVESPVPPSPAAQLSMKPPVTERHAASRAQPRQKVYFSRELGVAGLAGHPSGEDALRRLLQLVKELSPDDLEMLIRLATRLRE
jgi:transcriptional regulator with XRE-family HTH domain